MDPPQSPGFFGMHTLSPTRHWPTVKFDIVRTAGTAWGYVQTARGTFDWSGVDTWVKAAQAHGTAIVYTFLFTPQWASARPSEKCNRGYSGCGAPPLNLADWDAFVTALVGRYKGRICCYELWNEPNAPGFWTGNANDMVPLAQHAYQIIKAKDPAAIVVCPSVAAPVMRPRVPSPGWPVPYDSWLESYLRAGGGNFCDVVAWHGYTSPSNKPVAPAEDLIGQIARLHSLMAKYGMANKPLWDTEGGWGKDSQLPDPDDQVSYVARWLLVQFCGGVQTAFWYQWDNAQWGTLWDSADGIHPAGQAYGQVYGWLKQATANGACTSSHQVWTCPLIRNGRTAEVVWSLKGANFRVPAGLTRVHDLAGNVTAVPNSATLTLNSKPVLLDSQ